MIWAKPYQGKVQCANDNLGKHFKYIQHFWRTLLNTRSAHFVITLMRVKIDEAINNTTTSEANIWLDMQLSVR